MNAVPDPFICMLKIEPSLQLLSSRLSFLLAAIVMQFQIGYLL
jgi:hypothetical protein